MKFQPTRDEFHAHAAEHTVVPVWTELLADLETPVAAYVKLVGDGPGFLLESVEGAERWARFSFVGRNPSATLVLRDGTGRDSTARCRTAFRPTRACSRRSTRCSSEYTSPQFDDLPPLHGGIMGFLGYDVIREVEHLPDAPDRRPGVPRCGDVGDRFARRVRPLAPAGVPHRERADARARQPPRSTLPTTRPSSGCARPLPTSRKPLPYTPVAPPSADDELPELQSSMPNGMYQRAVEVAKEHVVAGDIFQVVLAQRYDIELGADPFDVYRVLRQVNPSPYMYYVKHPELTIVGSSPEPMVQLLGRKVVSRPIAGTRRRGKHRRARSADGCRADRASEGTRRARDAGRPRPQRRGSCRRVRHRARRRVDDARALQPRDAPDLAGVGSTS